MDQLLSLRVFVRVAETRSFTKAAESIGLPKASVSNYVQALENSLGTRLLHRTTRKVSLTQDGMVYLTRCKDLLVNADELSTLFQKSAEELTGKIRVDMSSRMARIRIIPKLPEFLNRYPRVQIELGSTDREVDLINEGYDCVIRAGTLDDSNLVSKKLMDMTIINCASPKYLKQHGTPKTLADLKNHYLVNYVSNLGEKEERFEYWDGKRFAEVPMKNRVTVNNAESYLAACLAGLGIIQVPKNTLHEALRNKTLIEILPHLRAESMPVSVIYPNRQNLPKRVRVFMDWIVEVLSEPA